MPNKPMRRSGAYPKAQSRSISDQRGVAALDGILMVWALIIAIVAGIYAVQPTYRIDCQMGSLKSAICGAQAAR